MVLIHPLIIEELACGNIRDHAFLTDLEKLPQAPAASHAEVLFLIASEKLGGSGLNAVDAHLLASARLGRATLWTRDSTLAQAAQRLGLAAAVS